MPNQKFEPTVKQREQVRLLARRQVSLDDICILERFPSRKTLLRCCRKELLQGRTEARMSVCVARFKMAKSGKHPRATIGFLKQYANWHVGMEIDALRGSGMRPEEYIFELRALKPDREPDRDIRGLDHPTEVFDDPWGGAADPEEGEN
jgi:hypothetical protein